MLTIPLKRKVSSTSLHLDRKSTRLNSSHQIISYAVFCLKKKKSILRRTRPSRKRPPPALPPRGPGPPTSDHGYGQSTQLHPPAPTPLHSTTATPPLPPST